jgi:hypothetical protein
MEQMPEDTYCIQRKRTHNRDHSPLGLVILVKPTINKQRAIFQVLAELSLFITGGHKSRRGKIMITVVISKEQTPVLKTFYPQFISNSPSNIAKAQG